jgi:hypothetical protein
MKADVRFWPVTHLVELQANPEPEPDFEPAVPLDFPFDDEPEPLELPG